MKCCQIRPQDLNRKVTIYKLDTVLTETGGESETWVKVTDVWAKIKNTSGSELMRNDQLGSIAFSDFTIRYRKDISETMKIVYRDVDYQIRHIDNVEEKDQWLIIKGERGVAQ